MACCFLVVLLLLSIVCFLEAEDNHVDDFLNSQLEHQGNSFEDEETYWPSQESKGDKFSRNYTHSQEAEERVRRKLTLKELELQDQRSKECNLIVGNVAEKVNEDLLQLVEIIGLKLGIPNPLSYVQRVNRMYSATMPRPIVIHLSSPYERNKWVTSYRKKRLWTEKWFLNEHLTRNNQELLQETKLWVRENKFLGPWTWNSRVYFRKNIDTGNIRVVNLVHLRHLERREKMSREMEQKKSRSTEHTILTTSTTPD
uniref:Uncharacterized protein n=1 Tax=Cacopsylla melanoneura TaxID=428564 RepID=A0A8D8Z689_9HEMI